ncbi:furin-like protease 2 [Bolinopsis microptera]|uniref:furin-like protease 2 n=1 Tax=Bolinopsis microptera TaxID=2820187 RepID=UPI00307A6B57
MFQLVLLSCLLVRIHSIRDSGFYLLDENKEYTNNGLLIADKISHHMIGSVCDDNFDDTAATVICREMKFNTSISFASGSNTEYTSWRMKKDFDIVLDDITCEDPDLPFSSCSIVTEHDCQHKHEQVFLWCGCTPGDYVRPQYKGCAPCPEQSVGSQDDIMSCVCGVGTVWEYEACNECPVDTYKDAVDESACQSCPEHSTSEPGAEICTCDASYFWNNGNCFKCPAHTVSSRGSKALIECISCPSGSSPIHGSTACSCAAGLYWNTTHCTTCGVNTYSTQHSTACSQCPQNTVSEAGSAHCTYCPQGHVWQDYSCVSCQDLDHDSCPRCPPGYSITPGNMCIEDRVPGPEKHKAAAKNWSTIVLGIALVVLLAFVIILVFMLFRNRRRSPPKSAAPLVPYHVVRESESYSPYEEPIYERPNAPDQNVIYDDPRAVQYVEPDADPMYVQSDRGEVTEYVQAETCGEPGYSVFCGNAQEPQGNGFTDIDNIYDNI